MKRLVWAIPALLAGGLSAFPLWLESPSRRNPMDPKSALYRPPLFPVATNTPVQSPTRSATPTPPLTATATPSFSLTFTPVAPGSTATSTPTPSPSPLPPSPTASFTASPTPSPSPGLNGSWPMLTNFNGNVTTDNAGGAVDYGNDNQEGGSSSSSSGIMQFNGTPQDGSNYLRWSYNVGTNAVLGYQYSYVSYSLASPDDVSAFNGLRFYARGSAPVTVKVGFNGNASDPCVPAVNKMSATVNVTASWQLFEVPFSSMADRYPACPFISGGWLADLGSVSFTIESLGGGTVDLDDLGFATVAVPTATMTPTPLGSNGTWPLLSNFEFNQTDNNAGGTNAAGNDNDDGCGSSASSASLSRLAGGSWDGSAHARFSYSVAVNAGCGYQYAVASFPMVAQQDVSAYNGVRFYVRGAAGGEAFKIVLSTANFSDPCIPGRNELSYGYGATTTGWQLVEIPFSAFTDKVGGCPYLPSMAGNTRALNFVVDTVSSGTVDIDDLGFATLALPTPTSTPALSNGAWPTLSTFNADISSNNAGGGGGDPNDTANDNQDGCGASSSSAAISSSTAAPVDATPFLRLAYTVGANAGCGYEYASVYFPFVGQDLQGKTSIDLAVRSTEAVRIQFRTAVSDACLPGFNRMWYDLPSTGGNWQALNIPFASFTPLNAGCPFPLDNVGSLSFVFTAPGGGNLDLDNISFP